MSRQKKLIVIAAAVVSAILVAVGATTVAVGLGDEEPGATTLSTGSVPTTLPATAEVAAPTATTATTLQPFGQTISALRHAGDHTPAAVIKGKEVPGWDPDRHAGKDSHDATEVVAGVDDDTGDDTDARLEPEESHGNSGDKDHVPAAVLMGKKVPGQAKK